MLEKFITEVEANAGIPAVTYILQYTPRPLNINDKKIS